MTKRTQIRIISYGLSAFALVSGAAVYQYNQVQTYKNYVTTSYQRAFYDLVDYVKTVDSTLEKGIHSSSPNSLIAMSTEIWAEAGGAKASMGQLPLSNAQLDNLSRFMSQVGDYSYTLAHKALDGEKITQEEQDTLDALSNYSKKLTKSLVSMEEQVNDGKLTIGEMKRMTLTGNAALPAFSNSFSEIETEFTDLPSLIYDGPYSDHLMQRESIFLKDKPEVTVVQAQEIAGKLLGISPNELKGGEGINSKISTFSFEHLGADGSSIYIDITKKGGYPLYFLNSRSIENNMLSHEGGVKKAKEFLQQHGYEHMKESYFMESEGILTVNFAFTQNEYTCYSDLIEVGVALDTGEIIFMEAGGYLMNHKENRDIPTLSVKKEDAAKKINSRLTPSEQYELAFIPKNNGEEVAVHSFLCTNSDERKYLVYMNTQTGEEEDIFMLIEDENGSLTM